MTPHLSRSGVCAVQADVKIAGIDYQVIKESVEAGMEANSHILDIMDRCIASPRSSKVSQSCPVCCDGCDPGCLL